MDYHWNWTDNIHKYRGPKNKGTDLSTNYSGKIKSKQLMSKKKNDVYFIGLKYAHSKQILQDQIRWGKKTSCSIYRLKCVCSKQILQDQISY